MGDMEIMNRDPLLNTYQKLEQEFADLIGPVHFSAEINLRLERISHLLSLLGDPHHAYPSIHIGGTSGKGSTAVMIDTILTEAGYKTGLHLSPHLQILNERHQINGRLVATTRLANLFAQIKPAIEEVGETNSFGSPSYFEAQAALAFYLFQQEAVDIGVVEVGLGGTLDATNVVPAAVAIITSIGLDHTEILGDTIGAIARDKAGIIKPGQVVISGVRAPEARRIIVARCQSEGARLWQLGRELRVTIHESGRFTLTTPAKTYAGLELGMKGDFQIENAACALAAVTTLADFQISEAAIRRGLQKARIPGRMEVMQARPTVILDGAHNPDKMKAVAHTVNKEYSHKRRIVLFSLKSGKDARRILPYVVNGSDPLILTAFRVKGLWEPVALQTLAALARELRPELEIRLISDPIEAIAHALSAARPEDLVWVTGSLYLVGDVREYWYPSEKLIAQAEKGLSGSLTI